MNLARRFFAIVLISGMVPATGAAHAQNVLLGKSFDDGDLTANPSWLFFYEAAQCFRVDSTPSVSAAGWRPSGREFVRNKGWAMNRKKPLDENPHASGFLNFDSPG